MTQKLLAIQYLKLQILDKTKLLQDVWNDEDEGERLALNNPKKHSKIPL